MVVYRYSHWFGYSGKNNAQICSVLTNLEQVYWVLRPDECAELVDHDLLRFINNALINIAIVVLVDIFCIVNVVMYRCCMRTRDTRVMVIDSGVVERLYDPLLPPITD